MLSSILLPDAKFLCLDFIEIEEDSVVFGTQSQQVSVPCPCCEVPSQRIHSSYQRHPADVPVSGYRVRLALSVHRFFCDVPGCQRQIFTERLPSVVAPYARRTERLVNQQTQVAYALGGEAGAFILMLLGMPTSPDTLLHLIRNAPEPELKVPRVLGVDDWCQRKGQSYGTILVDLETHQPVDLLAERSTESFESWLKSHPGVEIISRDRGKEYIKGANNGAPEALQVADRWHLLHNLREHIEGFLDTKPVCLKVAAECTDSQGSCKTETQSEGATTLPEASPPDGSSPTTPDQGNLTQTQQQTLARRARRQARYEAVKALHQKGISKSEIARRLDLNWRTVRKYIESDTPPTASRRTRRTHLDRYLGHLRQRWEEGCHNATQLWRELRQLGFGGCQKTVSNWAAKKRRALGASASTAIAQQVVPWSARRASWLLVKAHDELEPDEQQALERMSSADEHLLEALGLAQCFVQMVKQRQPQKLDKWLKDATNSNIKPLKSFAKGLKGDLSAVTNALSLPWSQGQTEGQVNRLKLVKRSMYGRANFDLLRKRVLAHPLRC